MLVAVLAFVLLYESRMLDSTTTAWQAMFGPDEQASAGTKLDFSATAYCKGTTTASGVRVRTGVAAADPKLLPVGSVVNVAAGDSKYDGVYTVMDTGPAVQGRQLDIYMWSCHEALAFGRKRVQVTVLRLGWDPTASSPTLIDRLFRGREAARRRTPPPAAAPAALAAPEVTGGETTRVAAIDEPAPIVESAVSSEP